MYEQESKKATHIMVLLALTLLCGTMIVYAIVKEGAALPVVMLLVAVTAGWIIHLKEPFTSRVRLWIYTTLLMLIYFYYGTHEYGVGDLAPIALGFMLIYTPTENLRFPQIITAVYYLTVGFDFLFLPEVIMDGADYSAARLLVDLGIVFLGDQMAKTIIRRLQRERKHQEDTIARLQEANQSAEDFLANASHELRTPINAVTGITTMLLKTERDPEKREKLNAVQQAGQRLFNQIEDILDYSEVDTGRLRVSEEAYSVTSIVNDIIVENRLMEQQLDVELIFDVDARIPASLMGDGRKIRKIIAHLTDNGLKFTRTGGVYVNIFALPKPYGINLCIRVSDTGIGIAEDELEKIKEKFFQSSGGRDRKSSGLGLGLSIVYGMVTAMDGFVQVESTEDEGTVMTVSIPQEVVDPSPCMGIDDRSRLMGLACYIKFDKDTLPKVRGFYNDAITHMVQALELPLHRVYDLEELKRLNNSVKLSHLFISAAEYQEDADWFESLSQTMEVIVIADNAFRPAEGSRIRIVKKPFYDLPIINILNAVDFNEEDAADREILRCPGVRVLVVDDEPMNLLVVEGIFGAWDMQVTTADSGMQAVELCRQASYDLIFLDHMMPDMDGVDTLRVLRKEWTEADRKPVVIAFSANVVSGAREMFLREGFDDFISKPLEERALKRLMRKVLPEGAIVYASESAPHIEAETTEDWQGRLAAAGLHTEAGMQYCNQDSELYAEVLLRFARDSGRKIAQLETALQAGDCKQYQIWVHALKSTSKMIGADDLSEKAKGSEDAAKARDLAYLRAHHDRVMAAYRQVARDISGVLQPEEAAQVAEITGSELLASLRTFREALDTYESDRAEALLKEMSGFVYQGTPVRELIGEIMQDVDDFEWDGACGKTDALIGSLEGGEG